MPDTDPCLRAAQASTRRELEWACCHSAIVLFGSLALLGLLAGAEGRLPLEPARRPETAHAEGEGPLFVSRILRRYPPTAQAGGCGRRPHLASWPLDDLSDQTM